MAGRTPILDCASEIRRFVARREYSEAVRRFEIVASWTPSSQRSKLAAEIVRAGGRITEAALTKAFARASCYFCRDGWMLCDQCEGAKTFAANGRFCDACGGLGRVPCTFCGGSGLLALDASPAVLRPKVAKRRIEWAVKLLQEVTRRVGNLRRWDVASTSLADRLRLLHSAERASEAAKEAKRVVASSRSPGGGRGQRPRELDLAGVCRKRGQALAEALATAIAELCLREAQRHPAGSRRRAIWERQAEFYESGGGRS